MEQTPLLYSLLFFSAFVIYLFFGIYIIHINPKANLNRLFLLVCISLCIWSFGFSIANSAPNIEICLLWRRISAVGWTSIYSLLLSFLLSLTGSKSILKRWHLVPLIHLPAAINMYVFAISNKMTAVQYNLVKVAYGWKNVAVNNGWDYFFYLYYVGYVVACLLVVWNWKRKSSDVNTGKQATLILVSIFAALLLGSITDVLLSTHFPDVLPQMAPLFTLLPIGAIHYSIQRYSMLKKREKVEDEQVLTEGDRAKLYHYLSIGFLGAGLFGFLVYFFPHLMSQKEFVQSTVFSSGIFFLLGILALSLQLLTSNKIKDHLIVAAAVLCIPVITLQFSANSGISIWAFPIILMIIMLIFRNSVPLVAVTVSAILTQVLLWVYTPSEPVIICNFSYIARIGIFLTALLLGISINGIYTKRLEENIYQANLQKIITECTYDFISIDESNFDSKINTTLGKIGRFFKVDHVYVVLLNKQNDSVTHTYRWRIGKGKPNVVNPPNFSPGELPRLKDQLKRCKSVSLEDIRDLPAEALAEKKYLSGLGVKSIVAIPIGGKGEIFGVKDNEIL
ncbi:MAG TPA: histidine kinase N-terminal 7TM domain-containing protein [Clostridia bacterium]|nr:histidine kinase N-terminal 7TM domain-containing protein [Clostridia bacterium]